MKNDFMKTLKSSIDHWYAPLIAGILFLVVGIYTFMTPVAAYLTLALFFSYSFLISGIMESIFSISNRNSIDNWGWTLTLGILTTLFGIFLIGNPAISLTTLPIYIGFLVLFRSLSGISYAMDLKNYGVSGSGSLMFIGVLGVLFSFLLLWNPLFAGMTVVFWTGLALVTGGIFSIYLAFRLKHLSSLHKELS